MLLAHSDRATTREKSGVRTKRVGRLLITAGAIALAASFAGGAYAAESKPWITTWAATPAPRWADDLPAPFKVPETLEDQTVRQVARVSVGGNQVRVVLSNAFGSKPLVIGAGSIAIAGKDGAIDTAAMKPLTWGGKTSVVIPAGAPIYSDPTDLPVKALDSLSISIYLPKKTAVSSVHWDGVQTGYISGPGDMTQAASFKPDSTTKSRLFLSGIMTSATPSSSAVVFLADSITDGFCSTVDTNNRWPDHVAERLQAEGHPDVAVVNEAYSGDRVLRNGMGTNALSRFDMSILSHPRVSTVVMMMGINDIGWPGEGSFTPTDHEPTAQDLEEGYLQIIDRAHQHGLRFVAVTLTPFIDTFKGTPFSHYYTPDKEKIRAEVNTWMRANKTADGLIDFDRVLEDPANPGHLQAAFDCGDHLHPNDAGYQAMAKAVDLYHLAAPTN